MLWQALQYERSKLFAGFYIDLTLTDKGMAEWREVIRLAFAHINKIRQKGTQNFYLEEPKWKKMIEFYFSPPKSSKSISVDYCQRLAEVVEDVDKQSDILIRPYLVK